MNATNTASIIAPNDASDAGYECHNDRISNSNGSKEMHRLWLNNVTTIVQNLFFLDYGQPVVNGYMAGWKLGTFQLIK